MSCIDADLLAAQKRVVNMALELSGAKTLQRFAAEMDARAHLAKGPRRTQFKQDMASEGLKVALKQSRCAVRRRHGEDPFQIR